MARRALTEEEQEIFGRLHRTVLGYRRRNKLRSEYVDGERRLEQTGFAVPPVMMHMRLAVGWPHKACSVVSSRTVPQLFSLAKPSELLDELDEVFTDPAVQMVERMAIESSLEHGCAFVFTTKGDEKLGEPETLVTTASALTASAEIDPRTRVVRAAIEFLSRSRYNLYLPGRVLPVERQSNKWVVSDDEYPTGTERVTCTPYIHGMSLRHPFGRSRVTRPLMAYTDAAVRTLLRADVTAEFYAAPGEILLGADQSVFEDAEGNMHPAWEALIGSVRVLPDEEDEMTGERHRAQVVHRPQMSMQPFNEQLVTIGKMVSGETSIPLTYLGIHSDSNPTSAEAIQANELDLVRVVKGQWPSFGHARRSLALDVLAMRHDGLDDSMLATLRTLRTEWEDPRTVSTTEQSNFVSQQIAAKNLQPGARTTLSLLPISTNQIRSIEQENRRAGAQAKVAERLAAADQGAGTAAAVEPHQLTEKEKLEALGIGRRAGATFESLINRLGLEGIEDSGAVPVSLRMPEADARGLEDT
jgi:hypothetical protein